MCTVCYIIHGHNKALFYIFPLITTHTDSIPNQTDLATTPHRDIGLTHKHALIKNMPTLINHFKEMFIVQLLNISENESET